ncbi:MAG: hypothetical protein BWY95_02302 [Bacteroidetes bacterium ADurb.BinA104]|nr:MAG: hypothetical protein BWY95_02302 [Bacteroidetes bacterium ADurb.BinA104]
MLGGASHSKNLGPEDLDHGHGQSKEYVDKQAVHNVRVQLVLSERFRCFMYKISVEDCYVKRTFVMDTCNTLFGFDFVTTLIEISEVFVLIGMVNIPALLLFKFMDSLYGLFTLQAVESIATFDIAHYDKQEPTQSK